LKLSLYPRRVLDENEVGRRRALNEVQCLVEERFKWQTMLDKEDLHIKECWMKGALNGEKCWLKKELVIEG